ncbi:hypothetical protein HPB52_005158 [Rhipicephalus sanguineus]|uniref:Tc1-like transposase DDE domain-containing protein n=1 Tax=Rhipicephalus sanguineus TaxID=34632 RepID=A0A9D4PUD0_RHISA|nr:hypothetical protein HPB52_005158 [Rhipicephalus sanguineus]
MAATCCSMTAVPYTLSHCGRCPREPRRAHSALAPVGADLNPIGNVWGILKSRLSARRISSTTSDALWQSVSEEWERLRHSPEVVVTLYETCRCHDASKPSSQPTER